MEWYSCVIDRHISSSSHFVNSRESTKCDRPIFKITGLSELKPAAMRARVKLLFRVQNRFRSDQSADPKFSFQKFSQKFSQMFFSKFFPKNFLKNFPQKFFDFVIFLVRKRGILIPINFYENPIKNSRIKFQFQKMEFWN